MKLKSLLILTFAALLALTMPRRAAADGASFDFFFDSLSPYGEWMEIGDYGYCWRPNGVDQDWSPYSDGYWAYTDGGWTWVSYEDYGGIVYHYGRWTKVEDVGWCWVPDYEWAPAWVSWRHSDNYVGWAPLPPEARWERERGFSVWVDSHYDIAPVCFNFCRTYDFGAPVLRGVIINRQENTTIINQTVNITNITYNNSSNVVFNGGPSFVAINRVARRAIPALKLVQNREFATRGAEGRMNLHSIQKGNQLMVLAPALTRPQPAQIAALVKPKVTRVIPQEKVTKGWSGVSAADHAAIKTKLQAETKGRTPESAPAKALDAAEVASVPVKADPKAVLPGAIKNGKTPKGVAGPERMPAEAPANTGKPAPEAAAPANPLIKPFNPQETAATEKGAPGKKGFKKAPAAAPGETPAGTNPTATTGEPAAHPDTVKPVKPGVSEGAAAKRAAAAEAAAAARQQSSEAAQKKAADMEANREKAAEAQKAKAQTKSEESAAAHEKFMEQKAAAAAAARERATSAEKPVEKRIQPVEKRIQPVEPRAPMAEKPAPVHPQPIEKRERPVEPRAPMQEKPVQARPQPVEKVAPAQVPHNVPQPANGKKKLTPAEEAAAQKGQ